MREAFAALLADAYAGTLDDFYVQLDESALARIQFIIRTTRGAVPAVDVAALEKRLAEAGRTWSDRLEDAACAAFGEAEARTKLRRFKTFPVPYQLQTPPSQAIADLERIDAVLAGPALEASLYPRDSGQVRLPPQPS